MGPVVLAAELLQVLAEESAHLDDAVGHALDLTEPLLVQGGVVHDGGGDAGTVDGRVGVEGTDENLDLRLDALLLLGGLADEGEGTDTLTVETLDYALDYFLLQFLLLNLPCSWRNSGTEQCCGPP